MATIVRRLRCSGALAATIVAATSVAAQDSAAVPPVTPTDAAQVQEDASATAEVVVTARRREESIVDVPLAISVVTSAKLEQLDLRSTSDLSNFVPGLQFSDYTPGYNRNDRGGTRPLIFRGINTGTGGSVTSAGGLFLDGAAVVGNELPGGMDIGAVEVLRGPQSVYFGRSTMTGAVSYRTKPIPKTLSGEAEVTIAERNRRDVEASVAGPIVQGLLGARLTGLVEHTDGYITNRYNNGAGKLGDRDRKSISGTLEFTPSSTLEIKGFVNYFHDDDGAAATALVPSSYNNCTLPGATRTTFCGKIPGPDAATYYLNTTIPANFADAIFTSPLIAGQDFKKKIGLQRKALNSHLIANWQVSDLLKLQSITGYHTNVTLQASDGLGAPPLPSYPYQAYFYTVTNRARDFSQELRASTDPERPLSFTVGANYVNAYSKAHAIVDYLYTSAAAVPASCAATSPYCATSQNIARDFAKTYGFFGGAYFKPFAPLTISAEGRYQIDQRSTTTFNPSTLAVITSLPGTFRSFNPRVSLDYDIGGRRKIYVSYASGTRPGGFNALLAGYLQQNNSVLTSQIAQYLGVSSYAYKEERLKIGEVGIKGNFAGGKGYFDLNAYYGKLLNQQVSQGALIPVLTFTITAITNIGETTAYGLEFQGNYDFSRQLSLATTFAWNHAVRNKFSNPSGVAQFGTINLDGVETANTPEYTGSAVLSYTHDLTGNWKAFSNAAYVYRGRIYTDVGDYSYIDPRSQLDLRAGVSNDALQFELFVTNLFNNRQYTNGGVAANSGTVTYHAFFGAQAEPRTFGGRMRVKF